MLIVLSHDGRAGNFGHDLLLSIPPLNIGDRVGSHVVTQNSDGAVVEPLHHMQGDISNIGHLLCERSTPCCLQFCVTGQTDVCWHEQYRCSGFPAEPV